MASAARICLIAGSSLRRGVPIRARWHYLRQLEQRGGDESREHEVRAVAPRQDGRLEHGAKRLEVVASDLQRERCRDDDRQAGVADEPDLPHRLGRASTGECAQQLYEDQDRERVGSRGLQPDRLQPVQVDC
jgi:hypothetical protein